MKLLIAFLLTAVLISCSRPAEKPKLSISEYTKQAVITKGVLEKILAEQDFKRMHEIAMAVESSRAVNCITVDEECNVYGEVLNKIVSSTRGRLPNEEENREIYKKIGELDQAFIKGHEKLAEQWKIYINETNKDKEK